MKRRPSKVQYRHYETPSDSVILALLGDNWIREYGNDIDELHFHNFLEIGYCYYGEGTMFLEEGAFPFSADMFTIIPPNYLHHTACKPGTLAKWEYLFIDLESFLRNLYADRQALVKSLTARVFYCADFLRLNESPVMGQLILSIMNEYRAGRELYLDSASGYLTALLAEVVRRRPKRYGYDAPLPNRSLSITNALDYVATHYHERIRIAELAEQCHISETHFRRVFLSCMSMTPVEYINLVRIEMACVMLRDTALTIEEVAFKCGFQTASTFNRNFKSAVGESPLQWRKSSTHYETKLLDYKIERFKGWQ